MKHKLGVNTERTMIGTLVWVRMTGVDDRRPPAGVAIDKV